jgi:hypothetical protein
VDVCERYMCMLMRFASACSLAFACPCCVSVLRFRFAFALTPARPHTLEMHPCYVCQPPAGVHVWFPVNQAVHYADSMAFHVTGGGNRFRCLLVFHYSSYPAAYLPPSAA